MVDIVIEEMEIGWKLGGKEEERNCHRPENHYLLGNA